MGRGETRARYLQGSVGLQRRVDNHAAPIPITPLRSNALLNETISKSLSLGNHRGMRLCAKDGLVLREGGSYEQRHGVVQTLSLHLLGAIPALRAGLSNPTTTRDRFGDPEDVVDVDRAGLEDVTALRVL